MGSIILDKEALYEVLEILKSRTSTVICIREIYQAIIALYRKNEPVDMLTVSEELKRETLWRWSEEEAT